MSDELCPVCGDVLHDDPENMAGIDAEGKVWPARGCLTDGLIGRRDDGGLVEVDPLASD